MNQFVGRSKYVVKMMYYNYYRNLSYSGKSLSCFCCVSSNVNIFVALKYKMTSKTYSVSARFIRCITGVEETWHPLRICPQKIIEACTRSLLKKSKDEEASQQIAVYFYRIIIQLNSVLKII